MSMHKGLLGQSEGGASIRLECCGNPLRGCTYCPDAMRKEDVTLADYIARKTKEPLTFDQWYDKMYKDSFYENKIINRRHAEFIWNASRENM